MRERLPKSDVIKGVTLPRSGLVQTPLCGAPHNGVFALFCSTELGAKHVGIIQSLIVTCRLHGIDPYTDLVDVLQRVAMHPAARMAELTPRLWKQHFADHPMRSDLFGLPA